MPTLFSYCIPYDDGAAPNPFWGLCTLVICKPGIRKVAQVGDWVVGTGSKRSPIGDIGGQVVYAMCVSQVLTMREYDVDGVSKWRRGAAESGGAGSEQVSRNRVVCRGNVVTGRFSAGASEQRFYRRRIATESCPLYGLERAPRERRIRFQVPESMAHVEYLAASHWVTMPSIAVLSSPDLVRSTASSMGCVMNNAMTSCSRASISSNRKIGLG